MPHHQLSQEEKNALVKLRAARRERRVHMPTPCADATLAQRMADGVARVVGSWRFIIVQSILLAIWIVMNAVAWSFHWDPYPFILLNLALSFQAAFTAPIIMMS